MQFNLPLGKWYYGLKKYKYTKQTILSKVKCSYTATKLIKKKTYFLVIYIIHVD